MKKQKKNKRLLMSFLAINTLATAYAGTGQSLTTTKSDRLYNSIVKNIQTGKTNKDNYKLIENILKKKNKELKDLYLQGDYIVKPEYLEWQIFFSSYYEEYNKDVDNTAENAMYHSDPEHGTSGYYDVNGVYVATGRTSGLMGKSYLPPQEGKEIRMGVNITLRDMKKEAINLSVGNVEVAEVTPITINVSPPEVKDLPEISVGTYGGITTPSISIPPVNPISIGTITASSPGAISTPTIIPFEVTVPTAPTVKEPVVGEIMAPVSPAVPTAPTVTAVAFNPVTPSVLTPSTFTPATLTFTPTGFGQGFAPDFTPASNQMVHNVSAKTLDAGGVVITAGGSSGGTWTGRIQYANTAYPSAPWNSWQTSAASYASNGSPVTVFNYVDNYDYTVEGDWTFTNTGSANSTTMFLSYNPYQVIDPAGKTVEFKGNLTLNHTNPTVNYMTLGFEHQLLYGNGGGSNAAMLTGYSTLLNSGTITLNTGQNMIAIMIDSEGTQSPLMSYTTNKGTIHIKSTRSIGIDFGQYFNSASIGSANPRVTVNPGYILVDGTENYGIRVANVFSTDATYYRYAHINGADQGNGGIIVQGTNNVGLSLSKQMGNNLIDNISNLNISVNGTEDIGILRRNDYAQTGNMVFTTSHIQNLNFGVNAFKSVLLRSDNGNITLDRDITINKGIGNNIVLQANGAGTSVTNNTGRTITLDNGATTSVGMLSSGSGSLENKGTINVKEGSSQGLAVLASSSGTNSGTISVTGNTSTGVYNAGTFNMTAGSITATNSGIGVYATGTTTNLTAGTLTASSGSAAIYANNATVGLGSGFSTTINNGGLLFYRGGTGNLSVTGTSTANINSGGTAFYLSG